jgi:hypothetical protein
MTRTHESRVREVARLIAKWQKVLFLHKWTIRADLATEDNGEVCASIRANHAYFDAHLLVFPYFWEQPAEGRANVILHELCHCLVTELEQDFVQLYEGRHISVHSFNDHVERLTQSITAIVAGLQAPRKPGP